MEEKLKEELKKAVMKHITEVMDTFPYWTAKFKIEEWDFEDPDDQAKLLAFFNALYESILETQPNEIEITLSYAVDISKCKEKIKEDEKDYFM